MELHFVLRLPQAPANPQRSVSWHPGGILVGIHTRTSFQDIAFVRGHNAQARTTSIELEQSVLSAAKSPTISPSANVGRNSCVVADLPVVDTDSTPAPSATLSVSWSR